MAQSCLHGCVTCAVTEGPVLRRTLALAQGSTVTILKFLRIFEQRVLYFYYVLGPTDYEGDLA